MTSQPPIPPPGGLHDSPSNALSPGEPEGLMIQDTPVIDATQLSTEDVATDNSVGGAPAQPGAEGATGQVAAEDAPTQVVPEDAPLQVATDDETPNEVAPEDRPQVPDDDPQI